MSAQIKLLGEKQQKLAQMICAICFFLATLIAPALTVTFFLMQTNYNGFSFSTGQPFEKFNWHPVLMVLGFNTFMCGATSVWTLLPLSHNIKKAIHGVCQIVCLCLVLASFGIVWNFKSGQYHIYTFHEYMGISTLVLYSCQLIAGLLVFGIPMIPLKIKAVLVPLHRGTGVMLFCMVLGSITSGFAYFGDTLIGQYHADVDGNRYGLYYLGASIPIVVAFTMGALFVLMNYFAHMKEGPAGTSKPPDDEFAPVNQSNGAYYG